MWYVYQRVLNGDLFVVAIDFPVSPIQWYWGVSSAWWLLLKPRDDIPYMKWKIKHVPNHQPVYIYIYMGWFENIWDYILMYIYTYLYYYYIYMGNYMGIYLLYIYNGDMKRCGWRGMSMEIHHFLVRWSQVKPIYFD